MTEVANSIMVIILSGLTLASLWTFYFWFFRQYRIDKTRQELFAIRDELFDYALNENIAFDHPAYILLRKTMNGMIRYTHNVDLISLLILWYAHRNTPIKLSFVHAFNKTITDLKQENKAKMIGFCNQMNRIIVKHLIVVSYHVLPLLVLVVIYSILKQGIRNIGKLFTTNFPGINQIDNEAAQLG